MLRRTDRLQIAAKLKQFAYNLVMYESSRNMVICSESLLETQYKPFEKETIINTIHSDFYSNCFNFAAIWSLSVRRNIV